MIRPSVHKESLSVEAMGVLPEKVFGRDRGSV